MARKYSHFIPRSDADRGRWCFNLKEKITLYATALSMPTELVTLIETLCQGAIDKTNKVTIKQQEYQEAVAAKNMLMSNELAALTKIAGIIKRNAAYTESMGKDLNIIGTSSAIDANYVKPVLRATTLPGYVSVSFNKQQQLGVSLYSRQKGTLGWDLLGRQRVSPFKDRRPLAQETVAEIREYMAVCWDGEEEFGQQSDIVFTLYGG